VLAIAMSFRGSREPPTHDLNPKSVGGQILTFQIDFGRKLFVSAPSVTR
jgi:hypothetical protein